MGENSFKTEDSYNKPSFKRGNTVKLYSEGASMEFPFLLLECDSLKKYLVDALRGIIAPATLIPDETLYNIYISVSSNPVKIGAVSAYRMKAITQNKLFRGFRISAHLSETVVYSGDMVQALCAIQDEN